ncbi:MAG: hypothetical protein ABSC37_21295, partial [Xanthobacteraceae bacterium]
VTPDIGAKSTGFGSRIGPMEMLCTGVFTIHAASAGRTRRVISAPRSRSTTAMSYWRRIITA